MKVILSSKLLLNDAQLSAVYKTIGEDSLNDTRVLFIADAAKQTGTDLPEWLYRDVDKFKSLNAKVDVCCLSENAPKDIEQKILESDILFFEGGSTPALLQSIKSSQIMGIINSDLCNDKVWFGVSAGGCVLSRKCYSSCEKWFVENTDEEAIDGLCNKGNYILFLISKVKIFKKIPKKI
jgi:peptidase E